MKARYLAALTYGFAPLAEKSEAPEVPKGAEVLLASRFPYLDDAQRRAILATTEIASNYPVINESRGWGRLNLFAAADGYGAFDGDVTVDMDADNGGFSESDIWRNDISGQGLLTKKGSGSLTLEGKNSYSGGTLLEEGTLIAASSKAMGNGIIYQQAGRLEIAVSKHKSQHANGTLRVSSYVQDGGTLALNLEKNAKLAANQSIYLKGGSLELTVPTLKKATRYTLLQAPYINGMFDNITVNDASGNSYTVEVTYGQQTVSALISPKMIKQQH